MKKKPAGGGRLIVLEGGEGAGKTTHAQFVHDWLAARGRSVMRTREPGGSPLAEAVRELVLKDWPEGIDAMTEVLLIFSARAAHLHAKVRPALEAGTNVVCDRFVDASFAYQGAGRGVSEAHIQALAGMVLGGLTPDLTLVFDIDPATGLARTRKRGTQNRFEGEDAAFMQRVREAYLVRARRASKRYAIIDAGRDVAAVQADLQQVLEQKL